MTKGYTFIYKKYPDSIVVHEGTHHKIYVDKRMAENVCMEDWKVVEVKILPPADN